MNRTYTLRIDQTFHLVDIAGYPASACDATRSYALDHI